MNKTEVKEIFIKSVERERIKRDWTQQDMADQLDMSLPGYRKMVQGLTESVALSKACRAAQIFDMPISALIESNDERELACRKLYELPKAVTHRINYYLDMQKVIQEQTRTDDEYIVDVYTMCGYFCDGVVFDSYQVNTRTFQLYLDEPAHRAIYISENTFMPTYAKGDILFINEKLARNGDVAVMMEAKTRRLYVRRLEIKENFILHPVAGIGKPLVIKQEELKNWINCGHVVGHYHLD